MWVRTEMKHKVFVACKLEDIGLKKLKAQSDFDVVVIPRPDVDEVKKELEDSDAIIVKSNVKLPADVLEVAKKLKVISRAGAGVDNVDLAKATQMGIPVTNAPGLNSNSVAELVFTYVHALYKSAVPYDRSTKDGGWDKDKFQINELRGKTIGIAGMGAVGRRVLTMAKGYGMQIMAYDPFLAATMAEDMGITLASDIKNLFKKCDIVTLHMPVTPETTGSITKDILCSMKRNAIFINTARSAVLAENALEDALAAHDTLRAGIDVHRVEKPGDKPLAEFSDRVLMTPHIAGNSLEGQLEIAETMADIVISALKENKLINLVNFVKIPDELDQAALDLAEALGHLGSTFLSGKGQLQEIRITCYGKFNNHADILVQPAIKGVLNQLLAERVTLINAENVAKDLGTRMIKREPDDSKGYGESVTVDVVMKKGRKTEEVSVRGKLIEGEPAIVRIDNYIELRVRPVGSQAYFIYKDKPGVIGAIATVLGKNEVNIESIHSRTEASGKKQLLIIRVGEAVSQGLLAKIIRAAESKAGVKIDLARTATF